MCMYSVCSQVSIHGQLCICYPISIHVYETRIARLSASCLSQNVRCTDEKVTGIDLGRENNLRGTLPPVIALLPELQLLNLERTDLSGTVSLRIDMYMMHFSRTRTRT